MYKNLKKGLCVLMVVVLVCACASCTLLLAEGVREGIESGGGSSTSYGINDKVVVRDLEYSVLEVKNTKSIGSNYL